MGSSVDTIFQHVGTTDKVYVEFGAEDCWECNTRYLRETGWDVNNSLLMDGMHSNPKINLKKVIFWPSNIIKLFERFGVKKEFDFLSVDTDNYDWFMLEAILLGGYRPRVICVEVNSRFEMEDAKSIPPPSDGVSWEQWDGTAYHGASDLAMYYLFNRFGYSMVFCNYSNCFGVRDDVLGVYVRRPISSLFVQNDGVAAGFNHPCDLKNRSLAVIDPSGRWLGELDGGKGSPTIRYKGCGRWEEGQHVAS